MTKFRAALTALLLLGTTLGCVTSLERGEALYRSGDRRAALETWRGISQHQPRYAAAQKRIAEVENELAQLVLRYEQQARYFEKKGRLAESILSYRLALTLTPDKASLLERAQTLSRVLATEKQKTRAAWQAAFDKRELSPARTRLAELRRLDPFDPGLELTEREFQAALSDAVAKNLASGKRSFASGHYTRAETAFRSVLQLDPKNESAQGYLSYIATIRSAAKTANHRPASFAAPELEASDEEIRAEGFHQNALAAMHAGNLFQAIDYDLRALEANPTHEKARTHLAKIRTANQHQAAQLTEDGRAAFQQEDLESALELWRNALRITPDDARLHEFIARAERMLANLDQLRDEPPKVSTPKRGLRPRENK